MSHLPLPRGTREQGFAFSGLESPDRRYFAQLTNVDENESEQGVDVTFELVPYGWMMNSMFHPNSDDLGDSQPTDLPERGKRKRELPPSRVKLGFIPVSHLQMIDVPAVELAKVLGVSELIEGEWFEIELGNPGEGVDGVHYDPDQDIL